MNEGRMIRRLLQRYGRPFFRLDGQDTPFVGVLQPTLSANRLYPEDVRILSGNRDQTRYLLLVDPTDPPLQEGDRFQCRDPQGNEPVRYYILKIILHHLGRTALYRQCIVVADWEEDDHGTR